MDRETGENIIEFWTKVVWSYSALPPTSRLLLLTLAYLVNPAGNVTMTQGALADMMNVDTVTLRRALRACERQGSLAVQPVASQRQGTREGLTYQLRAPHARPGEVTLPPDSGRGFFTFGLHVLAERRSR